MGIPQTRSRLRRAWVTIVGSALIVGCFGRASVLPNSVTVELPDGTLALVVAGSGAPTLANSRWQFFEDSASSQSAPLLTATFGADGELVRFDDNRLGSAFFGATIIFDGQRRPAMQEGLEYAANAFGAQTSDAAGITFEARFTAFAGALNVGNGIANAAGTYDTIDPNSMAGSFHFESNVTVPINIPDAEETRDFAFVAHRLAP